jgi:hypothetical protein
LPFFCLLFASSTLGVAIKVQQVFPPQRKMPKNRTSKIQGDMEAFKKGYWGGNIEGALKKVDLEKTYLEHT